MNTAQFRAGLTYDNVYLLFVDAAGSSTIVAANPRDHATKAFDLLRDRVLSRVDGRACARAELWSWGGDGGFLVVHDQDESVARDVAMRAAIGLLTVDLPALREEFRQIGVRGELHLRISLHKAAITCPGGDTGSIHSPDIDFAAHLEGATPSDCLAVSDDVHRVSGDFAELFEAVGIFEGRRVHVMSGSGKPGDASRAWLTRAGLTTGTLVPAHPERPSQQEKARLVDAAQHEVVDQGTALNTCAGYLMTTERPALYRQAVLDFINRGGTYRGVLLDPACPAAAMLGEWRQEDMAAKINRSLERFARFKQRQGAAADGLHIYQTTAFPGFASLSVDIRLPNALVLYSPYLMSTGVPVERADMPHYLLTPAAGRLFTDTRDVISSLTAIDAVRRVL